MPKVSVIIPVYNVEQYLRRCVDSVLSQSFQDFEIILVDDGSPDNSGVICDEYAANDSRINVVHKENGGPASARNVGLAIAQGEYIYFLDSDDYIEYELLEQALLGVQGYDMVSFDFRIVDEYGAVLRHCLYKHGSIVWHNEEELFQFFLNVFFPLQTWGAPLRIFRKSIIDEHGLSFEEGAFFAEDLYFTFAYLLHCHAINCLDAEYYNYVQHSGSVMYIHTRQFNFGRMVELTKAIEKYLNSLPGFLLIKSRIPILFCEIFSSALNPAKRAAGGISIRKLRSIICLDVQDINYFQTMTIALLKQKKMLRSKYGYIRSGEILSEYRYFLDGNDLTYELRHLWFLLLRKAKKIVAFS